MEQRLLAKLTLYLLGTRVLYVLMYLLNEDMLRTASFLVPASLEPVLFAKLALYILACRILYVVFYVLDEDFLRSSAFVFAFTAIFYLCHHFEIMLYRVTVRERLNRYIWNNKDSWRPSMKAFLTFLSKLGDIANASIIMWSSMFLHGLMDETFGQNVVHALAWPLLFMTVGYATRHYFLEWPVQDSLKESTFTTQVRNNFLSWIWAWQMMLFVLVAAVATVFVITQAQPVVNLIGDRYKI